MEYIKAIFHVEFSLHPEKLSGKRAIEPILFIDTF
jgi:hypothetical protein